LRTLDGGTAVNVGMKIRDYNEVHQVDYILKAWLLSVSVEVDHKGAGFTSVYFNLMSYSYSIKINPP
jgi:hypothetical protein